MKAKRITIWVFVIVLASLGFSLSAAETVKKYDISDNVNGLDVSSAFHVTLKRGPVSVVTRVGEEFADFVTVSEKSGVVFISLNLPKGKKSMVEGRDDIIAEVSIPSLEHLKVSGTAVIDADGTFDVTEMEVCAEDDSRIGNLSIRGAYAEFGISGNSSVRVRASIRTMEMYAWDAASLNMDGVVTDYYVDCSGFSHSFSTGEFYRVFADCSGSSSSTISGKTYMLSTKCSGTGFLRAEHLMSEHIIVEGSGSSTMYVAAGWEIEGTLSDRAILKHRGGHLAINLIGKGCAVRMF